MMRRRYSKTSYCTLDLAEIGGWRQLRTSEELSRNGERGTINCLGDREASIILGNRPQNQENQGQVENQSELAKHEGRADLRD